MKFWIVLDTQVEAKDLKEAEGKGEAMVRLLDSSGGTLSTVHDTLTDREYNYARA